MQVDKQYGRSSSCKEFHSRNQNQQLQDNVKFQIQYLYLYNQLTCQIIIVQLEDDLNQKQRINEETMSLGFSNTCYANPLYQQQRYEQLENMYCNLPIPATKINLNLHFQIQKNVDIKKRQQQTKIIRSRKIETQQQDIKIDEKQGYNPNYGTFQKFPKRTQSSDAVIRRKLMQSSEGKHRKFIRTQSERNSDFNKQTVNKSQVKQDQDQFIEDKDSQQKNLKEMSHMQSQFVYQHPNPYHNNHLQQLSLQFAPTQQQQSLNNNGVLMQSNQTQQVQKQQSGVQQMLSQKNQQTYKEIEDQMGKNMNGNQKQDAIVLVAKRIPINQSASETNLRGKTFRQSVGSRNQENKLDVIIQGSNNFSSDRWNYPRGYIQNKKAIQAPDLSPKNQIPINQNQIQLASNQLYALQNQNSLSGQDDLNTQTIKFNQKREAISQQYFMTSSSNSLSYSFFPTKSHLISNNQKGSQKQIVKGQIPSLSIITQQQQQKLEYQTSGRSLQISDSQKKGETINKQSRKSGNNFHTENIKNLFSKNNEQILSNGNTLSGNNCSGTFKIPQSESQERRIIQSSSGQPNFEYKQIMQTDELPILKEFSNKQNRNIFNDKIDQFLASDYKLQQKNLQILLQQEQQTHQTYGNEISNTEGVCKSFPDNDEDEDNNITNSLKKSKKNLVFAGRMSNKPLSERQNEDYQNIYNLNINKLNFGPLQSQSFKNYQQNQIEQNTNTIKNIQQFSFKNGSKFEQTMSQSVPLSVKNTNIATGNSSSRNQQQIQQDIQYLQNNAKNNFNQSSRFQNLAILNNQGNIQNIPDMAIYGQQTMESQKTNKTGQYLDQYKNPNNIYYSASKQEQLLAYSYKGDESSKDNLSSFKENPHSSSSTQFPSLNIQGGSQSMKSSTNKTSQKEDFSQQQYLIDAILEGNRQRSKVSPSSSHIQRRSQVGEQQVSRKRNQQKPSYLLSDESELPLPPNQLPQNIGGQVQGTYQNLLVNNDFQNSQIISSTQQQGGIELQLTNDQFDNINSESTPQSIQVSQQNNQLQNQDINLIELAINNLSSQDQQKRQLLRLNPYKIRYLELQQKKMLMQMTQPDQIQQLDLKGLQNLQNQYSGGVLTNLQTINQTNQQQLYRYYVGYGNNAELIKRLLKSRDWWCEYNSETQQGGFNFRWTQGIQGIKYDKLNSNAVKQCVNHFEEHREISQKDLLVKNLKLFCETNKIYLFSITPCTFLIDLNDDACELQITKFANFFCKYHPNKNYIGENYKKAIAEFKKNIKSIYTNVNANYKKIKSNVYSKPMMYPSFVYNSNNSNDGNYIWLLKTTIYNRGRGIELFSSFEQLEKQMIKYADGTFDRNLYLAEEYYQNQNEIVNKQQSPSSKDQENNNNQQDSLSMIIQQASLSTQLSSQLQQISSANTENIYTASTTQIQANQNDFPNSNQQTQNQSNQLSSTKNKEKEQKPVKNWQMLKSQTFVFQKYIEKPMLINGRKFDMRMFVLVTHNMDCYFYKCGYIRTASELYRMDDLDNQFIHLTNNAVQKYAKNYGEFEDGNILSLEQFDDLIKTKGIYEGLNLYGKIIPQIREICLMTLASVKKKFNSQERKHCFELFGYDFFIDEDYRVWLIEVNSNPSIEESNEYLHQFMPRLLDDTFRLTIDKIFPPPPINQTNSQNQFKNNQNLQFNPIQSSPNGNQQNKFTFQKRNSSLLVQQSSQKQTNQTTENNQQEIYSHFQSAINNNNSSGYLSKEENQPSSSKDIFDNKNSQQNNCVSNTNLNVIKEEDNSQYFTDKNEIGVNNIQNEQSKQNLRKREKFPLVGHSDDENLWQFMTNLTKFNFSLYSQQALSSLSPQAYHPLKDILTQSNKIVNSKSNSKKNKEA